MSINLVDNILVNTSKPIDSKFGPYINTTAATDAIPAGQRYIGLTVGILEGGSVVEYWFKSDTTNLVKKESGTTFTQGTGITISSGQISIDPAVVQVLSNLSTNVSTDGTSDTKYPSVKAVKTYADGLVVGLLNDRGNYTPSTGDPGPYPSTGGSGTAGAIMKGDIWFIESIGYLGNTQVAIGASVRALVNTPGQTDANWDILDAGLGFTPENSANRVADSSSIISNSTSTVLYPSVKAVFDFVGTKVNLGLTDVLTNNNTGTNKNLILDSTTATEYFATVKNTQGTNKRKVEVKSTGVFIYPNDSDTYNTQYANKQIVVTDSTNTRTFNFPATGGTLALEGGNSVSVAANAGLDLTASVLKTTYNTTRTSGSTVNTIGGITAGTNLNDLKDLTIVQILDRMFFPTQFPTYTNPTIAVTGTGSLSTQTLEVGVNISGSFTSLGTKNDAGAFSAIRLYKSINSTESLLTPTSAFAPVSPDPADILPQFGFPDPNNPNKAWNASFTETLYTIPAPLTGGQSSTVSYYSKGDYAQGLKKLDSSGATDPDGFAIRNTNNPQAADTNFQSNLITITGIYPVFYGTYNYASGDSQPSSTTIKNLIEAKAWNNSTSYVPGNIVKYNTSDVYVCITATSGAFVPGNWNKIGTCVKSVVSGGNDITIIPGNISPDAKWWFVAQYSEYPQKTKWTQVGSPTLKNSLITSDYSISTSSITSPDFRTGTTPLWASISYRLYVSLAPKYSDVNTQQYIYHISNLA